LTLPTTLGEAVALIARIGGYLQRGNSPPPGCQVLWNGYAWLQFICIGFSLHEDQTSDA
jgi:hypothetical protein